MELFIILSVFSVETKLENSRWLADRGEMQHTACLVIRHIRQSSQPRFNHRCLGDVYYDFTPWLAPWSKRNACIRRMWDIEFGRCCSIKTATTKLRLWIPCFHICQMLVNQRVENFAICESIYFEIFSETRRWEFDTLVNRQVSGIKNASHMKQIVDSLLHMNASSVSCLLFPKV